MVKNYFETANARIIVESNYEWFKWCREIPRLNFKSDWGVRIMPPFGGSIVRFNCEKNEKLADVYLDCYDELGFCGEPYWELYPYDEDVLRCSMHDTEKLLSAIDDVLEGRH